MKNVGTVRTIEIDGERFFSVSDIKELFSEPTETKEEISENNNSSSIKNIYRNIEELCSAKGMFITTLEERAGLGRGAIGKWRNVSPTVSNLEKVATALGVSISTLLR